jgi:hypothetical protein
MLLTVVSKDLRFGTWNVKSLYRSGSLKTVARELRKYKLDLSGYGIRMDLREIGLRGVNWIRLAHDRDRWRAVVSAVMIFRVLAPRS